MAEGKKGDCAAGRDSEEAKMLLKEVILGWEKGFSGVSLGDASTGHKSFVFQWDLLGKLRFPVFTDLEQSKK